MHILLNAKQVDHSEAQHEPKRTKGSSNLEKTLDSLVGSSDLLGAQVRVYDGRTPPASTTMTPTELKRMCVMIVGNRLPLSRT